MEVWHPCSGFEAHYEVSTIGNVRSIARYVPNRWGTLRLSPSKLLKYGKSKSGYLIVSFCVDGVKSNQTIHRLVARAFIENESNKPQVNHKDGNKHNNCVENLEWVTVSENGLHAYNVLSNSAWNKGKKLPKYNEERKRRRSEEMRAWHEKKRLSAKVAALEGKP